MATVLSPALTACAAPRQAKRDQCRERDRGHGDQGYTPRRRPHGHILLGRTHARERLPDGKDEHDDRADQHNGCQEPVEKLEHELSAPQDHISTRAGSCRHTTDHAGLHGTPLVGGLHGVKVPTERMATISTDASDVYARFADAVSQRRQGPDRSRSLSKLLACYD